MRQRILSAAFLITAFSVSVFAQTPKPTPLVDDEKPTRVTTEEIRLNIVARNEFDHFDPTVIADDLMVVEDRVPHKIESLRRVPASVMLILDMGGEMRTVKNIRTTQAAAAGLIRSLSNEDRIAIIQYSDRVQVLSEWETKDEAIEAVAKKLDFGRRSVFVEALKTAAKMLDSREAQNRHIVLITDGLDSLAKKEEREAAIKKLLEANVSIHVLSYTAMERNGNASRSVMVKGADGRIPRRTDEAHKASLPQPIQDLMNMPRIGVTINTDREMLKKARQQQQDLIKSQEQLNDLAFKTGGTIVLPESDEKLVEQSKEIAKLIDSVYVATYIPKRPLEASQPGETREIGVVSRRVGLKVEARRVFIVPSKTP
ncbi:MAG: VWA domain-containing protein [Acidobacteriota bacterium]|nr:VWA domain-containing protein [Acidobacteriota bacterium]